MMMTAVRFLGGLLAAMLPARLWEEFDLHVPVLRSATLASALTLIGGVILAVVVVIEDHPRVSILFLVLKARGWLALYLIGSGTFRVATAVAGEPRGDTILTLIDTWRQGRRTARAGARLTQERVRREGPVVPDRVMPGAEVGRPDAALAIVAARRKAAWSIGTTVIRGEEWLRVADIIEQDMDGRLRTIYLLLPHAEVEVARHVVRYDG